MDGASRRSSSHLRPSWTPVIDVSAGSLIGTFPMGTAGGCSWKPSWGAGPHSNAMLVSEPSSSSAAASRSLRLADEWPSRMDISAPMPQLLRSRGCRSVTDVRCISRQPQSRATCEGIRPQNRSSSRSWPSMSRWVYCGAMCCQMRRGKRISSRRGTKASTRARITGVANLKKASRSTSPLAATRWLLACGSSSDISDMSGSSDSLSMAAAAASICSAPAIALRAARDRSCSLKDKILP
mmetsp:Transcript_34870/g.86545  ORF Transcript_34870/g.86545 Transcript_34870/m.86545 type:complete len:239 (-) Transcript_34870:32-748(-)